VKDFRQLALAGFGVIGTVAACAGGTETDNPGKDGNLVAFDASACKKEAPVESGRSQEALVTTSDYDGLRCVEWEKQSDGELTVRLLNVNGGCSVPWKGEAVVRDDGSLELRLVNPTCAVAHCGWCIYDFSFTLRGAPPAAGLPVEVGQVACPGTDPEWDPVIVLPDDAGDSGILCRYANQFAYDQQLAEQGRCGSKFGTCGDQAGFCTTSGTGPTPCSDGLVCAATDDTTRCLEPCTTDADCSPRAVSACVDGICRLSATY
jgi:hypothetical protein